MISDRELALLHRIRRESDPRTRPVRCVDTGKVYPSTRDVESELGTSRHSVAAAIRREHRLGGSRWEWVDPHDRRRKGGRPAKAILVGGKLYANAQDAALSLGVSLWAIRRSIGRGWVNVRLPLKFVDPAKFRDSTEAVGAA